jgi:3-hydroxymyristoyl/3-hydroxydecanoyl-(acyl carrier protein) dehydratase
VIDLQPSLPEDGFPAVTLVRRSSDAVLLRLLVDECLCWFAGHFPGLPVLPGIIQLHWAVEYSRRFLGASAQPEAVNRLKFSRVVQPPVVLELALQRTDQHAVKFTFSSGAGHHSQGHIVFGQVPT